MVSKSHDYARAVRDLIGAHKFLREDQALCPKSPDPFFLKGGMGSWNESTPVDCLLTIPQLILFTEFIRQSDAFVVVPHIQE